MIDELIDNVWNTPSLIEGLQSLERQWLASAAQVDASITVDTAWAARLLEAAAILACSPISERKLVAYRIATYVHDLFRSQIEGVEAAVRVVLARLGNFPGMGTSAGVRDSLKTLPWQLAGEEIQRRQENTIASEDLTLTDYQKKLWGTLNAYEPTAISAPTSAGKSFLVQAYIVHRFRQGAPLAVAYVVPTRALIAQVQADLTKALARAELGTVDVISIPLDEDDEPKERAVFVMTQERLQVLFGNHPELTLDIVVVDEAHSVEDGDRGILLQSVVDEITIRAPRAQVIFATPTVSNLDIFQTMAGLPVLQISQTDEATVSQNFVNVVVKSGTKGVVDLEVQDKDGRRTVGSKVIGQALHSRVECLVHVSNAMGLDRQSIVYANGQADAEKIAFQLSDLRSADGPKSEALQELAELAREAVHPMYLLATTVGNGIGFHYGNIPTILRAAVEKAFDDGHLTHLVCTSTLLSGVNLPAGNLFLCEPNRGNGTPLGSVDFWNLAGRAGRLSREFQGNIYLINYDKWKDRGLDGPRSVPLVPAIQQTIEQNAEHLEAVIRNDPFSADKISDAGMETIFVRLLTDYKRERIDATLSRASVLPESPLAVRLKEALDTASRSISLSAEVLAKSPTISAYRQQRLFDQFVAAIEQGGETAARGLLPKHPRESQAYDSYVDALTRIHGTLLARPGSVRQNRFFALMILRWMQGVSIAELVDGRIAYQQGENINKAIRDTLDLVEKDLRFNYVRSFGAYVEILREAFIATNNKELVDSIPSVALYLEVGASDRTMVSFLALGLSRLVAKRLNDMCPVKTYDLDEAKRWLLRQNLETLGLSRYLRAEIESILGRVAAA